MTSPRMPLSSVYLDSERVGLLGDPRPRVSKVLAASGKARGEDLEGLQVLRLPNAAGREALAGAPGPALPLDEVIDRTSQPSVPVYLVLAPRAGGAARPHPVPRHHVAFPNPGSPLPRLRGIPEPARPGPRPYRSRAVWLGPDAGASRR